MKIAILISVFLGLLATVFSSTMMKIHADPRYPGMCMVKDNMILKAGEHENPETCGLIHCHNSGMTNYYYCPMKTLKGCTKGNPVDVTKPFPDCCDSYYTCPQADGSVVTQIA